jgi:predicted component of type VI protein secretion system
MPIKLLVTHAGDDTPDEYVFDEETVMIGRDGSNLLTLPDPARIVSKHHAEIRTTDDGAYELVDLGSKNFTYLNGKRLVSGQPSPIRSGDRFKVGDFEIDFQAVAAPDPEGERTVFAATFSNPFEEPAEKLAEVLGSLRRLYASESGPHRADALRDALDAAMIGGGDEPGAIVARLLGGGEALGAPPSPPAAQPSPAQPPPGPPPAEPPKQGAADPFAQTSAAPFAPFGAPPSLDAPGPPPSPPPQFAPPPQSPPPQPPTPTPPAPRPAGGAAPMGPDADRLLDVLVEAVSKLVAIPWRFRHEFIGQTIVQSDDSAFLYEKAPPELKAYLTDARVGPQEREARLGALAESADAVVVHQLAMLDGYKASVQQGAKRLLDAVDPAPVEEEVEASSPMYKVPQLRAAAVLERVKETHRELGGEDWSVAERRAFRPAFIKAYLARMTRRKS